MRVYHDFVLVPGSKSAFPDTDPDPAKWYGSDRIRIRIRNTVNNSELGSFWSFIEYYEYISTYPTSTVPAVTSTSQSFEKPR